MCLELGLSWAWEVNMSFSGVESTFLLVTLLLLLKWKWGIEFYLKNHRVLIPFFCFAYISCQTSLWNFTQWATLISSTKASAMWTSLSTDISLLNFCLLCLFWRPKRYLLFTFFPWDASHNSKGGRPGVVQFFVCLFVLYLALVSIPE